MVRHARLTAGCIAVLCLSLVAAPVAAVTGVAGGGQGSQGDLGGADAVDPASVEEGATVGNLRVTFVARGVSRDGGTDVVRLVVPNALAEAGLSVNGATVENASTGSGVSISSSAELVDGPDGDGVADTVRLAVSPTGGGTVDANVRVDLAVTGPSIPSDTDYGLAASVEDSDGSSVGPTAVGTLTVLDAGGTTTTSDSTPTRTATPTDDGTATSATGGDTRTATPTPSDDTTSDSGPGFGALAALVGLLAAAASLAVGTRR